MAEFAHLQGPDTESVTPKTRRREDQAAHGLMRLQRLAGNAAVSLLVQRQDDPAAAGPADAAAPGGAGPAAAGAPAEPTQFMTQKQLMITGTIVNGQPTEVNASIG
jgi:hypothetical protein